MYRCSLVLALVLVASAESTAAQISLSGQVDFVAAHGYDAPLNQAFRGDDPFNEVRMRLFAQHWVDERIGVFTEVLFDVRAQTRVNGAYVVIRRVADKEWLDARIGMVPSPLGNFGMRSTYFTQNPLIGVPLVWHYRTALDPGGRASASELIARRDANSRGLPVMYDACWPIVAELFGSAGIFDYSVAGTAGAVSNPMMSLRMPGWQALARVGVRPSVGFRLGLSAAYGPYIGEREDPALVASPPVADPADPDQLLFGYDLEYARGRVQLFSEGYVNRWDSRSIGEGLGVRAGYVETRVDVTPRVYVAARLGGMDFSEIAAGGQLESWDDDLWRLEAALGFRLSRESLVRAGWQRWHYTSGADPDQNVLAIQLSTVF